MIKLGRVSSRTKGPILIGFSEDPDCLTPGGFYVCVECG